MRAEEVVARFQGSHKTSSGYTARCPAHDDREASLSVGEGADGRILLRCHAGCSVGAILDAVGITFIDLFPKVGDTAPEQERVYDYREANGGLLYQAVRYPPKKFRQRRMVAVGHPGSKGSIVDGATGTRYGHVWDMKGVRYVPYRLPELKNQPRVVVAEGEKDADRLWSCGIPATTNIGGAKNWQPALAKQLKDAGVQRVVILPDNDGKGLEHAEDVAARCKTAGLAVRVTQLPGLGEKGDVSDWLDAGHSAAELQAILDEQLWVVPAGSTAAEITAPMPPASRALVEDALRHDRVINADATISYHKTDLGAAEAFCDRCGHLVRYDHLRGKWLIWSGHYWRPDADEQVYRLAYDHVRTWQREALAMTDMQMRHAVTEWAFKLEKTKSSVESFVTIARRLPPIATPGGMWDSDPWLLGTPNGVVDLRTGLLRDGRPDDFITLQTGVPFDPDAPCPRWMQFLAEIFEGDADLIHFNHKALGYSLTADMREQVFFMLLGRGSNGKSLYLSVLERIWGQYGIRANMLMFVGNTDLEKFHMADLAGRRFVFAAETKKGMSWREATIKNFTGGETLRVEHKNKDPFTFTPAGKIWLGMNDAPTVDDDSLGFWRRVRLVPFKRTFTASTADHTLEATLRREAPGILAWAVRGALLWQAEGLVAPASVMAATANYKAEEDPLTEFLKSRTEADPDAVAFKAALFSAYGTWAEYAGMPQKERLTRRAFGMNMNARFDQKEGGMGGSAYRGLRLIRTEQDADLLDR